MRTVSSNYTYIKFNTKSYTIHTPTGVFKDITDALEVYPNLKEIGRVKECPFCNKYFFDLSTNNNRKYCSKECAETYNIINKREIKRMWERDKKLRDINNKKLEDVANNKINPEFHQDDRFWGVGESNLNEHMNEDMEKEYQLIKKELKRINKRWNNEYLK